MARGLYFSEFSIDQTFTTVRRTITETDVVMFAGLSGDYNPLHTDVVFAEKTPFGQRVAIFEPFEPFEPFGPFELLLK